MDRRLQQLAIASYGDYLDYLRVHQGEFTTLSNTVLINVTGFFRDRDPWENPRSELLPALLSTKKPVEAFRVWCAGCASGEKACAPLAYQSGERTGVIVVMDQLTGAETPAPVEGS